MKKLLYLVVIAFFSVFVSCKGSAEGDETDSDTLTVDTLLDTTLIDSSLFMYDSGYVDEALETNNLIEAKYGEQWEFCDCVVKNDSVNTAIENASDEEFDAILERMDVIDQHCKTMLTAPNTTPDEREAHDRKVRKCLKNAK